MIRVDVSDEQDDVVLAIPNGVGPAQAFESAVDGIQEDPDVVPAAKHHPTGNRRDHLDVWRERRHESVEVACLRGGAVAGDGVLHQPSIPYGAWNTLQPRAPTRVGP